MSAECKSCSAPIADGLDLCHRCLSALRVSARDGRPLTRAPGPQKHNLGKPRLSLAMGPGFVEVGRAMTFGATKYSPHNYSLGDGLPRLELIDAAARHVVAYLQGEDADPESGLHPLAHAAASLLMTLDLIQRGKGVDGRYCAEVKP